MVVKRKFRDFTIFKNVKYNRVRNDHCRKRNIQDPNILALKRHVVQTIFQKTSKTHKRPLNLPFFRTKAYVIATRERNLITVPLSVRSFVKSYPGQGSPFRLARKPTSSYSRGYKKQVTTLVRCKNDPFRSCEATKELAGGSEKPNSAPLCWHCLYLFGEFRRETSFERRKRKKDVEGWCGLSMHG